MAANRERWVSALISACAWKNCAVKTETIQHFMRFSRICLKNTSVNFLQRLLTYNLFLPLDSSHLFNLRVYNPFETSSNQI